MTWAVSLYFWVKLDVDRMPCECLLSFPALTKVRRLVLLVYPVYGTSRLEIFVEFVDLFSAAVARLQALISSKIL